MLFVEALESIDRSGVWYLARSGARRRAGLGIIESCLPGRLDSCLFGVGETCLLGCLESYLFVVCRIVPVRIVFGTAW